MANEDARDNGVLGKALGMAGVVALTGGGIALGALGTKSLVKGGINTAKKVTEGFKDFKASKLDGVSDTILNNVDNVAESISKNKSNPTLKPVPKNTPEQAFKSAEKVSSEIASDRAIGNGIDNIIMNAIAENGDPGVLQPSSIKLNRGPSDANLLEPKSKRYNFKAMLGGADDMPSGTPMTTEQASQIMSDISAVKPGSPIKPAEPANRILQNAISDYNESQSPFMATNNIANRVVESTSGIKRSKVDLTTPKKITVSDSASEELNRIASNTILNSAMDDVQGAMLNRGLGSVSGEPRNININKSIRKETWEDQLMNQSFTNFAMRTAEEENAKALQGSSKGKGKKNKKRR